MTEPPHAESHDPAAPAKPAPPAEPPAHHDVQPPSEPKLPHPPLVIALVPVIFLIAALATMILRFGDLAPSAMLPLALATAVAALIAWSYGCSWRSIVDGISAGVATAIPACLILMIVGALIGTWMLGGIVPTLIVYGLKLISPTYYLLTAALVCALVSSAIGSSWSTAATVGVALIAIGKALAIPPGMCAGAIISGAYFGDKISPLSDTTNLAPAVAGAELFEHIRHMLYTTVPSLVVALVLYWLIGLGFSGSASGGNVEQMVGAVQKSFVVHWGLLLVPVAVVALVAFRVPALPALLIGAILGGVCAWLVQGASLGQILTAAQGGFVGNTGSAAVDKLVSRGGINSMLGTVALIILALGFGGVLERGGMLRSLAAGILRGAKRTGSLVLRTILTSVGMNILAADQYMAVVIPGRMYKDSYAAQGLHPKNLSRALEDAGTLTSPLVPWNSCGAYMAATLKVSPEAYLWYAFLNLLNPLVSIFYGYTGITMERLAPQRDAAADGAAPDGEAAGTVGTGPG